MAGALEAAYLRIDAIETAVARCGLAQRPVGPVGYVVAHEIAAANLSLGTSVVVDAVNPVPEARAGWQPLAELAQLVFLETVIANEDEHRRRVTSRRPDMEDQVVPTWDDVVACDYRPWVVERDGARHVIDMTDTELGIAGALSVLPRGRA